MKAALSIWKGRIAPLFDVSERCLIIDTDKPDQNSECVECNGRDAEEKARYLADRGVKTIICGAISNEFQESFLSHDIEIISFIAGPIEGVLKAFKDGTLLRRSFSMPGCGCPRRRCRRRGCKNSLYL